MPQILLVEDSKEFLMMVTDILKSRYQVSCAPSIAEARSELARHKFDLIVLDVTLPDGDGFEFCSEIQRHEEHRLIPIVFLTGRADPKDKVLGWNLGADDYIQKPINPFEFQARIDARMKKASSKTAQADFVVRGPLKLDLAFHEAKLLNGEVEKSISLTKNEFRLLHHLVRNQDRVLSRAQLQTAVWGNDTHITDRTIDKHISAIRQKLESEAESIETVTGIGYRFSQRRHQKVS